MPHRKPTDDELRAQIEAVTSQAYSTEDIEQRIARALLSEGHFDQDLNARDLAIILRNVIYTMFAQQTVAGHDFSLVHNVPSMKVAIKDGEAQVCYVVHIHRPIVAFLEFKYTLVNDPVAISRRLRLKRGTLEVTEHTRRLDLKARAALAAISIETMARRELTDVTKIIRDTLPPQLARHGVEGTMENIELALHGRSLRVVLAGRFWPLSRDGAAPQ